MDGTLIPVRVRSLAVSSRNYRFSANVQVIVYADTRLVIAAARPVPGTTADTHAWRASGLCLHCQGVTVLGDGAYSDRDTEPRKMVQATGEHPIVPPRSRNSSPIV